MGREPEAEVLAAIPHRPPFLFVDRIVECDTTAGGRIRTEYEVREDEIFVGGHYPGNPIMPGVLICEAILQSGAILATRLDEASGEEPVPVLSRLKDARFRRAVKPGEVLEMEAECLEHVAGAMQMRGTARVAGKTAVTVSFTSASVPASRLNSGGE